MGPHDEAIVGDAAVGVDHLEAGDEHVALADGDIAVVASLPAALLVGSVGPVVPLPLGIGNSSAFLAGKVDARLLAQAELAVGLLQALGLVGIIEALADLVVDDVARIGDAVLEIDIAVARLDPTMHTVVLAEPRPPSGAVPG